MKIWIVFSLTIYVLTSCNGLNNKVKKTDSVVLRTKSQQNQFGADSNKKVILYDLNKIFRENSRFKGCIKCSNSPIKSKFIDEFTGFRNSGRSAEFQFSRSIEYLAPKELTDSSIVNMVNEIRVQYNKIKLFYVFDNNNESNSIFYALIDDKNVEYFIDTTFGYEGISKEFPIDFMEATIYTYLNKYIVIRIFPRHWDANYLDEHRYIYLFADIVENVIYDMDDFNGILFNSAK